MFKKCLWFCWILTIPGDVFWHLSGVSWGKTLCFCLRGLLTHCHFLMVLRVYMGHQVQIHCCFYFTLLRYNVSTSWHPIKEYCSYFFWHKSNRCFFQFLCRVCVVIPGNPINAEVSLHKRPCLTCVSVLTQALCSSQFATESKTCSLTVPFVRYKLTLD